MVCGISCAISAIFIIATIYTNNATSKNHILENYKAQLPENLLKTYEKITAERLKIYYQGFAISFAISFAIILYNYLILKRKISSIPIICIVVATSFVTQYFYYALYPKTDWMLNHIRTPEQTKAWLQMYKGMQFYYHAGLVLGIISVGFLAFAFR